MKEFNRLEDNRKILSLLKVLVECCPDQRFGQILSNYVIPLEITDIWNPEGEVYINRMQEVLKKWKDV